MNEKKDINALVAALADLGKASSDRVWSAVRNALTPERLIDNLSEALQISSADTEKLLEQNGFGDLVTLAKMARGQQGAAEMEQGAQEVTTQALLSPFTQLFSIAVNAPTSVSEDLSETVRRLAESIAGTVATDPFVELYRGHVPEYYESFMKSDAPKIMQFVADSFGGDGPRYLLNSGIGANEQSNHFVAYVHNSRSGKKCEWLIMNSPRQLVGLPSDSTVDNTLFMEFSRSGKTEETVKIHEYTPRRAKRIVFANAGPLRELGERDGNLVLELPAEVSGRFGRDKTPILLAPMLVAGLDTRSFWKKIQDAIEALDLTDPNSLPFKIAKFIYGRQKERGINHIYLGCNDDALIMLGDELTQFWNEGVNKGGNDITMSRYLGLPRDSHMNLEAILADHKTKLAICLFGDQLVPDVLHPMIHKEIDPINHAHSGLRFGDEEKILAEANYARLSELMPCLKITLHGRPSLDHAAVISQLWADVTYCYSRLMNIDPGSNPEVKAVRDRAASLLAR